MSSIFVLAEQARAWCRVWGLDDGKIATLERAIRLDLDLARSSRPRRVPSAAALLHRQARALEKQAERIGRTARRGAS